MISIDLSSLRDSSVISGLNSCKTEEAKYLCLVDLTKNLHQYHVRDIGGTYRDGPEFWFCYKYTGSLIGTNLISIFVCHRKTGQFTIKLPDYEVLLLSEPESMSESYAMRSYSFHTIKPNEVKYLKSFTFKYDHFTKIDPNKISMFLIPVQIQFETKNDPNSFVIKSVQLNHNKLMLKAFQDKPFDFNLVANSGNVHQFHKIMLAAHSTVLKDMINNTDSSELKLDIDDCNMETLKEFLYTGYINDFLDSKSSFLKIAKKYNIELKGLLSSINQ